MFLPEKSGKNLSHTSILWMKKISDTRNPERQCRSGKAYSVARGLIFCREIRRKKKRVAIRLTTPAMGKAHHTL